MKESFRSSLAGRCIFFPPNFYADDDVVVVFQTRHPNDGKVIMTTNMMIINPYQQTGALRPPLHADR